MALVENVLRRRRGALERWSGLGVRVYVPALNEA